MPSSSKSKDVLKVAAVGMGGSADGGALAAAAAEPPGHDLWERAKVDLIRWAPKVSYSHLIGWLAERKVPRRLRAPLFRALTHRFGIDLSDAAEPGLDVYPDFNTLFTRRLRPGARPVDRDPDVAVSPCDAVVVELGIAHRGRLVQAKGRDYTVEALLCDAQEAARLEGGAYACLYLCPADYHRVHAPLGGTIEGARHIPGALFPVNPPSVRHVAGLFTLNERVVTYIQSPLGRCAVVMVAATGVGNMTLAYAPEFRTSLRRGQASDPSLELPRRVDKGDELGVFNLGSTVIVLFPPGQVTLLAQRGASVRMGQALARRDAPGAGSRFS